ncbi:3-deoxy-7-phosphoheptulonate synthase [Pseudoxanthomonas sacheonensis]|uniref:Phospho-2-dehydro-3-deoxyheptonate aldolase n=1 Tax=Pseudoxanthomonas sacheonensis TaxID=443615 RepID=A0ABU1RRA3_9GAMM|nr:3-deoxy-7-phosphoheptulonate synthase [Pseudoxanthomonas sacheonensis]MDR6841308.1 3-deoxy-7-phosphoheptulonate synthase [Pseudoxanthomonas sacheonensis]
MNIRTDDLRILDIQPITAPEVVMDSYPATSAVSMTVDRARRALRDILHRRNDRLIVVIGPCSIHDVQAALDYAQRLQHQRQRFADTLEIVMRVYFEKPRTTVGWKGLINDPRLDGSYRIDEGLQTARRLLLDINALGLPAGCEFLDMITPQYIADLVAWGAIGARTTESQVHRELASGLSCPVGFKNGTEGNIRIAVDAAQAAAHSHRFLSVTKQGRSAIVTTLGNEDCHVILRGGRTPNYDAASVDAAGAAMVSVGLTPRVMIDASHANSGRHPERQPAVINDVSEQIEGGESRVIGVMVESHLVAGRQDLIDGCALVYGQSVTDGCLGWDDSVRVLERLSRAVEVRRRFEPLALIA